MERRDYREIKQQTPFALLWRKVFCPSLSFTVFRFFFQKRAGDSQTGAPTCSQRHTWNFS